MCIAFASPPFYTTYVKLPAADAHVPYHIFENPRFFPFLERVIGAIDGTHIKAAATAEDLAFMRDRKGEVSQNVLACCDFDLKFTYVLSGVEGSAADSWLYNFARQVDFNIPAGRFYVADAGFGGCDGLLVPYRQVRYHLAEWGRADVKCVFSSIFPLTQFNEQICHV